MKAAILRSWAFISMAIILPFTACNTTKTTEGAVIGGTAGGVIGGLIGGKENTAAGVIIGSAIGGTAGALIGNYMDKQARELERELENAEIERVGEGILITFDSGLLFDLDSYQLRAETKANLIELSEVLREYDDTNIIIEGHTDNQGTDKYNQRLSERRARSVSGYLAKQNVSSSRFTVRGYGEEKPVATNETAAGRQENRRVEVAIVANEDLKEAAEEGEIGE